MSNVASRFNVQMIDEFSLFASLLGHKDVPQNVGSIRFNILSRKSDFYTTFHQEIPGVWTIQVSFPTSTSMDLRFDCNNLRLERIVGLKCICNACTVDAIEYLYAMSFEQCFTLVFVDIHCITESCERKNAFELCGYVVSIIQSTNTTS